jgi:hypothetical protein
VLFWPELVPPQVPVRGQTSPLPRMPEPIMSNDPFASMPRLRPFTDFELDPVDAQPEDVDPYSGRSRQNGVASPVNGNSEPVAPSSRTEPVAPGSGRHTNANGDANGAANQGTGGGRRRRTADGDDDVLARILGRGTSS